MFGQGGKCPRIISGLNSARYRGQRSKPSPKHIDNCRILYIGELICVAEIEDCIRVVTHPKNLPLGACRIEAFIYPVPKGETCEAREGWINEIATARCAGLAMTDGDLVGIRTHGFVGGLQALEGDAFGLAGMDDALLVRGD